MSRGLWLWEAPSIVCYVPGTLNLSYSTCLEGVRRAECLTDLWPRVGPLKSTLRFFYARGSELSLSWICAGSEECTEDSGSGRFNLSYVTCLERSGRLTLVYFTCLEGSGGVQFVVFYVFGRLWEIQFGVFFTLRAVPPTRLILVLVSL